MSETWLKMSMSDLGRGIAAGRIDPVELTETYLAAIDAHEFAPRIYARVTADRARAEARAAADRAARGVRLSPLDGVPISWKDLFDTAGIATEAGSALLEGRRPEADAEVLARATAKGLVCLGKTHMSELAFSGLGYNPVTATPPCINDHAAISGGSSSGAAASVAFGLAACGIGSDTAGSVRVPAAWNDLVGLKTSAGHLPLTGTVPLCESFDTIGPLARSVEDAAAMFDILSGDGPAPLAPFSLEGARFAILETYVMPDLHEAPRAAFEAAIARLEAAGARIETIAIPEVDEAMALAAMLYTVEAYAEWGEVIEAAPDKMFPEILKRFRGGRGYSGVEYARGWKMLHAYRRAYDRATRDFDGVLMPSVPSLPPKQEHIATDSDRYVAENLLALRNTRVGNVMGLCALSLPTGTPSTGLMLNLPGGADRKLLEIGAAIEAALA